MERTFMEKYKSAFDDMSSREDFHYTGIDRIVCEGGYTYYWLYSSREKSTSTKILKMLL